jgi:hypothetical protein
MAVCGAAVSWLRGKKPETESAEPPVVITAEADAVPATE